MSTNEKRLVYLTAVVGLVNTVLILTHSIITAVNL